jgi:hypothetical protein
MPSASVTKLLALREDRSALRAELHACEDVIRDFVSLELKALSRLAKAQQDLADLRDFYSRAPARIEVINRRLHTNEKLERNRDLVDGLVKTGQKLVAIERELSTKETDHEEK